MAKGSSKLKSKAKDLGLKEKARAKAPAPKSVVAPPVKKPATGTVAKPPTAPVGKATSNGQGTTKKSGETSRIAAAAVKAQQPASKPTTGRIANPALTKQQPPAKAGANGSAKASATGKAAKPSGGTDRIAKSGTDRIAKPSAGKPASSLGKSRAAPEKERPDYSTLKPPIASDELQKWRQLLLLRRSEISNDIAGLVKDAMETEDGHTAPDSAERGTDADMQDMSLGMVGEEENILWQIDRALRKIDKSSPIPYGICEFTKEPIPRSRLQLIPWTPLSIEGATHMEQNNMVLEDMLVDE
jgi:DnaK suppressor protein